MEIIDLSRVRCFVIKCSDWSVVVDAPNETEACTIALTKMMENRGKDLKLSSIMISHEITADYMSLDESFHPDCEPAYESDPHEDLTSYHSVSRMLANAGFHDLSLSMKTIFNEQE